MKLNNEGALVLVQQLENIFLTLNLSQSVHVPGCQLFSSQTLAFLTDHHNFALGYHLHCIHLSIDFASALHNFGKGTLAQNFDEFEVDKRIRNFIFTDPVFKALNKRIINKTHSKF